MTFSSLYKFVVVAILLSGAVQGGRHGSMGGWRRRLQDNNPVTDFCDHFPEWGTFYDLAEKTVMYAPENDPDYFTALTCSVATCGVNDDAECDTQEDCEAEVTVTVDGIWDPVALTCSVSTCGVNDDAECDTQADCVAEVTVTVDGVWDTWTDSEGNPAGNATPQECDTLRNWADDRKSFIQDPNNQGAPGYEEALHTMILLENHYACCTIRTGTSFQIMDLLSRLNLLCSSYDITACDAADEGSAGYNDCRVAFSVCPAVTAPEGQEGLDLDAIGNYGAVVIGVNSNFQESDAERRRLSEGREECKELNSMNAMNTGKASLLLSWGTEYYGQQLGHVALIIGDLDHTQEVIPDERWVSFGPASNSADYQPSLAFGDTYDLLQGMKPHISGFANEYGLFDDYITFNNVDEQAMIDAWTAIRQNPGRYSMIDRNCMTVVADIMNAGLAKQCQVNTRWWVTPHAFFQTISDLFAASAQLVQHDDVQEAEKAEAVLRGAFTLEKEEVPECSNQCDLPDTHPFHCERTSYLEIAIPKHKMSNRPHKMSNANIGWVSHEKVGVECMQLAKDMRCEYGSLCRNANYQREVDHCSNYQEKKECVTARIWKSKTEELKKIERDSMCIWKDNSCFEYTPGDCSSSSMANFSSCVDNDHVCELESYNRREQTAECSDITAPSCPSIAGFPTTQVGDVAAIPCDSMRRGRAKIGGGVQQRKCVEHDKWGPTDNSQCHGVHVVSVGGFAASFAGISAPAPMVDGRRLIDLDELAELTL